MTIGYITGTVIAGLFVLVGIAAIAIGPFMKSEYGDDNTFVKWSFITCGIAAVLIASGIWVGATFPPFQTKYHSYRPIIGTVSAIGNRLLGAGDSGTTQEIVVTIAGQDYRCDDTRCSLVKVGDILSMQCIGVFELHGVSGWRCNYVSDEARS